MSELDCADDYFFRNFLGAGLDHDDAVFGADNHDVEQAGEAFGVGRVDDVLLFACFADVADPDRADGAVEWDVREGERAACAVDAEDVRIVFLVGGIDERNDLGFIAESFREERADGAIDLAGGEDFLLAGTALALDEAAGDASASIGKFAVFNRQREEVNAFLGVGGSSCGGENGVVATGGESGAWRLPGHTAGFEFDVLATGELNRDVLFHV